MKDIKVEDVVKSMASTDDNEAAIILKRYCAHVVERERGKWVLEAREEREKRLENSSFTSVIEYLESGEWCISGALKKLTEAFREREDHFYRERQR